MRRVTQLDGAYSVDGRAFGPFRATEDRPYLEVPDALVNALGLNLHESDPQLIAQQAQADAEEGIHVDQILEANASLKAELDHSLSLLGELAEILGWQPTSDISPAQLARNIVGGSETNRELLAKANNENRKLNDVLREKSALIDSINAHRDQVEAERDAALAQIATTAAPGPVTLPDGLRADLIALKGISEQRADEILGMVNAALNPAPAPTPEADPQ